ncbi:carboxypeptidase-like regulatory domain-containing protein [Flavobacterium terrae]|uniref:CarboxypepD_reg-like domain-containing protein n=1 Tax=Flavobacterium terrae TaxID=415425 RepID=A0A1M6EMU7_9FLAO|nr:carboxypeptidase-like regulatory domain-containing protein [Flavobacterium terrae]SHI86570.1 CarboxypepD_reg-like domain-containing protein [Flavobacterium terrae]
MRKLQLTIPEPCHEDWNKMTPVQKGRFCSSCEKNVFDFTRSTDLQIIEMYNKNNSICGRFLPSQLDRELFYPKKKKSVWLAAVFFGMITFFNTKVSAQEKPKTEQTETPHIIVGKVAYNLENQDEEIAISGIVSDASGPLPGVNVIVKGTTNGTQTGFDGLYNIKAKKGDILIFSFMGMKVIERTISISRIINVKMEDSPVMLGGAVIKSLR